MKFVTKGLAVISIAVIMSVTFSSTANAASLLGLFSWGGQQNQEGNSSDNEQDQDTEDSWFTRWRSDDKTSSPEENTDTNTNETTPTSGDEDGDGLSAAQETEQKTSATSADTDNDGLSDFVESAWYPDRNEVFCGSACAYPDPVKRDLYLELDWMVRPDGSSTRPTDQQLAMVTSAFAKEGIAMHIDGGQLGGGNAVPYHAEIWFGATAGEIDFVDYKRGGDGIASQFNAKRNSMWHYMIIGEHYKRIEGGEVKSGSSGVANASGPNAFIAAGVMPQEGRDGAMAGTIMHELGHNLCLVHGDVSSTSGCTFPGIDNHDAGQPDYAYKDYKSAMNYLYQFQVVDYSHNPTNSPYDHNDWASLKLAVFARYNESANGQSQETAFKKRENNMLSNFNHTVSKKEIARSIIRL